MSLITYFTQHFDSNEDVAKVPLVDLPKPSFPNQKVFSEVLCCRLNLLHLKFAHTCKNTNVHTSHLHKFFHTQALKHGCS